MVQIGQRELEDLIDVDARGVREAKERVVRVTDLVAHGTGVQDALVRHRGGRLVGVLNS